MLEEETARGRRAGGVVLVVEEEEEEEEDAVGRGGRGALKASLRSWLTAFRGVIHKVDPNGTTPMHQVT